MTLLILSFLAGILTIAAPCTLTLLPIIVGGSLVRSSEDRPENRWKRPLTIAVSLALSVVIFTLLLKYSTSLLGVPAATWQIISGVIIIGLGVSFLVPRVWEIIALKSGLHLASNKLLGKSFQKSGLGGDILTGLALGPVFSGCSPTFAFVVASVLPKSFAEGMIYLVAYAVGLAGMLLTVAYLGQGLVSKLGWLSDPNGLFRKVIGVIFIIVGLSIMTGFDKRVESYTINQGWYAPISNLENSLR